MGFEETLLAQKNQIVRQWFQMVVDTYPLDTSRFLKSRSDPFSNPVGSSTKNGLDILFDEIAGKKEMDKDRVIEALDPIIRIRAVQDFTPSRAAGFIFFLKKILRETLIRKKPDMDLLENLAALEARIDEAAMHGFDIYMRCREQIYQIKANEIRKRTFGALSRAGLLVDTEVETGGTTNS